MRPILADLWRRWRLWLLIPGLAAFGTTGFAPELGKSCFLFPLLGSVFLSFELARGVARPTLIQPVSRRDMAQAWWIFAVVIPWAVCVAGAALGWGVRLFHDPSVVLPPSAPQAMPMPEMPPGAPRSMPMPPTVAALTWGIALKGLLIQAAFCAVWDAFFFFALAMLPVARSANTATQIGQGFGGALWGLNVGASIFIMQGLGRMLTALPAMHPAAWALLAASGPMVLVSLLLSENLVRRRTELPSQPLPPPQAATRGWKLRLGESLGGLRQFIVRETVIQSVMVWGFAVMGWIGFTALLRYQGARDSQPPAAMLGGFFALVPAVRSMLPSMRHLRSLPISGSSLASVLVLMPAGIVLVNTLLVNVVFSGFAAVSWAIGLAQGFGLASVAALGVALSMRIPAPFMIVALGMVSGPLMWLSHGLRRSGGPDGSLLAIVIVSAAGVMALTFLLARHWLRTSPVLYRPQRLFGLPIGAAASR